MQTMIPTQATPPFTRAALEILFEKSNFASFQKAGFRSHYWAPLLSAFSGTSRNEIFYLTPEDVFLKYGLWIIQTNAIGAKKGQAGSRIRDIPLHPALKRLGFLEFVQDRRQTHPNERLFSEYKASQEHAGMVFSRSFVHWIKTTVNQLPDDRKNLFEEDFHFSSLRALFSVEAIRSGMSERTFGKVHGISHGFRRAFDEEQDRHDLENAEVEIRRMDIESSFPALCTYEDLVACP
jgi:integrase